MSGRKHDDRSDALRTSQ